jgi:hypothetical protein
LKTHLNCITGRKTSEYARLFRSIKISIALLSLLLLTKTFCGAQTLYATDSLHSNHINFTAKEDYKNAYDSLLKYQKSIASAEEQQNEQIRKAILFSMIPFVVAFIFVVFVFYRRKRESVIRERETELKHQIAEVEMKALRAQINPHFIFNSLNSIHRFILVEKPKEAGEYLLKFANLIRLVLENSLHKEVSLKEDIQALKLYIEMEQVRMNDGFDYTLEVDPSIDIDNVVVPPLIVQPFVENSIWHGLNNVNHRGILSISISRKENMLRYCLEDNGGSETIKEETTLNSTKKKSLGMSLTRERLDILNLVKGSNADFTIIDNLDANQKVIGKKVELVIPFEEAF